VLERRARHVDGHESGHVRSFDLHGLVCRRRPVVHQLELQQLAGMLLCGTVMRRAITVRMRGWRVLLDGHGEKRAFLAAFDTACAGRKSLIALDSRC
jgi:hypothetical protein